MIGVGLVYLKIGLCYNLKRVNRNLMKIFEEKEVRSKK